MENIQLDYAKISLFDGWLRIDIESESESVLLNKKEVVELIKFLQQNLEKLSDDRN